MEYAKKGSIMNYNEKKREWTINQQFSEKNKIDYTEDDLRSILFDIAFGLEYSKLLYLIKSMITLLCIEI